MSLTNLKLNFSKAALAFFNLFLSFCLFFSIRRFLLRLVGIKVGSSVTVHRKVKLFGFGNMEIGDRSTVNYGCYLDNRAGITIGRNVNISHCVKIYSMGHNVQDPMCSLIKRPVFIEDNAWIFPNSIIMPGVRIGTGAVVYPGSVVTKDVDPYSIVGGNPAKTIGARKPEICYELDFAVWFAV